MTPLHGKTRAEVWLTAAKALFNQGGRLHNLILEVEKPDMGSEESAKIESLVNAFLTKYDCHPLHTVAETIFPAVEYRNGGIKAVYDYPKTVYPHIKSFPGNQWGTYALRLTERKCSDGTTFTPLQTMIGKMKRQLSLRSPKRSVYELDLMSEPLELKLYEADEDRNKAVAGQCLSHLSFKLGANHELYLTAVYRYQWFVQKALGNLLGLARLQACVAQEIGVEVGPLVCHATLAALEDPKVGVFKCPWDRPALAELLEECEATTSLAFA